MANETPVQAVIPEQKTIEIPLKSSPPNEDQNKTAPNIDGELDDALSKAFSKNIKSEEKAPEPTAKDEKKIEKNESKEVSKIEPTKKEPEGELPNPETLGDNAPKKQDGWTALKNNYKRAHKVLSEKDQEIQKLKSVIAEKGSLSTKEVEELKAQVAELSKYRTVVDIQADPEFISQYDKPIEKAKGSIKEMLLSMQVSEQVVDQLDFSNTKLMDEIIGHVGEHRDKIVARKLQRKIEEVVDLMDKKTDVLSEKKSSYQEFIENKKKEAFSKGAEEEGRMVRHLESLTASKDKAGAVAFPFLVKQTPSEGMSQGEIDHISNHNNLVDLMGQKLKQALSLTAPEDKVEVAVAAVASHYLSAKLREVTKRYNEVQEELKKISNVGSETEKTKVKPSGGRNGNSQPTDVDSALRAHFSK